MLDDKKTLLGKIEALKITNESFSNFKLLNSFSLNNKNNPLDFSIELLKTTRGNKSIQRFFAFFVSNVLLEFENELKEQLKKFIIKIFNCSLDDIIPNKFFVGFVFPIKSVDFFGLLKINPDSDNGKYFYESDDLNTVLYSAINSPSTIKKYKDLLDITFSNNKFTIKISNKYKNKNINVFVSDFYSDLKLYDTNTVLSQVLNNYFGSYFKNTPLSKENISDLLKTNLLIKKHIDSTESYIDDSYYEFTPNELLYVENESKRLKNGVQIVYTCSANIIKEIENNIDGLLNTNLINEQSIIQNLDIFVDNVYSDLSLGERENESTNLFSVLIKELINVLFSKILSPKVVVFLMIYKEFAFFYTNAVQQNVVDFIKQYKGIYLDVLKKIIYQKIISALVEYIAKEISDLILQNNIKRQTEQIENYTRQIKSLVGINGI